MKFIFILLFSISSLAQTPPIKIEIDSISDIDTLTHRKFIIKYSIRNITNNRISFFLNPERIHASSGGSMSTNISGTLFQEKEELPMHTILSYTPLKKESFPNFDSIKDEKVKNEAIRKFLKEVLDIDIENDTDETYKSNDSTYQLKKSSERLMKSIMSLNPFESKEYSKTLYWDKKRYHKVDELEYYIDEKSTCYLQLYIVLLKEEFKERLTESDYNALIKIPNFTKGWYSSNKVPIDFSE